MWHVCGMDQGYRARGRKGLLPLTCQGMGAVSGLFLKNDADLLWSPLRLPWLQLSAIMVSVRSAR
ncbi:hypothetical protein GCM10007079_05380 [Nocardiopsis terrae]|nr:hypothetical protein GCM10007079_05380 [Nocardiopsis terrae]